MQGLRADQLPEPTPFLAICEPAPWDPVNDPIIAPRADRRTNGTAPGATELLVSILTNDDLPGMEHLNASLSPLHYSYDWDPTDLDAGCAKLCVAAHNIAPLGSS
jgi:hypothetical protein